YSNQFTLYTGLRTAKNGGESTFPFGQGWGMAPASPNTVDAWKAAEPTDKRFKATILDCQKELEKYYFDDNCEDGGYAVKKYLPVTSMKNKEAGNATPWDTFWCYISDSFTSSNDNNMQGSHYEDIYLVRYADVLLMYAELANDQGSFDKVRARAGLGSKALTFENLKAERRWEFLGEGLRWSDMRRFSGSTITETSYIATCLEGEAGALVKDGTGADIPMAHIGGGGSWKARLVATQALFAKPYTQIALSNYMTQNAGWVNQSDYQYKGY
ncbi:MAG: RagB/SusD family nutrient uptake outer membrane protein, partial [Bacteroidales bacterium]|nr:RagB/SusD family nutrient uptake outer membrane protein [Bacteroidales bacterium]